MVRVSGVKICLLGGNLLRARPAGWCAALACTCTCAGPGWGCLCLYEVFLELEKGKLCKCKVLLMPLLSAFWCPKQACRLASAGGYAHAFDDPGRLGGAYALQQRAGLQLEPGM